MLKYIAKIKAAAEELRLALVQVRELLAAIEGLIVSPEFAAVEKVKKELGDVIESIKTKGV